MKEIHKMQCMCTISYRHDSPPTSSAIHYLFTTLSTNLLPTVMDLQPVSILLLANLSCQSQCMLRPKPLQITPKDTEVLNGYLDESQHADTQMRTRILEKAMGDIYRQRPGNSRFDKKDAKQVSVLGMHISIPYSYVHQKSRNGFTTTREPTLAGGSHSLQMVCKKRLLS
jgi:hypothetical protein